MAGMHGTYVGHGRVLVKTTFGARLLAPSDDLGLMPELVAEGCYDAPFTSFLQRELSAGGVAVDVGANLGLFTLLMAWQVGPTGAVVAYEPEPRNFELLEQNVSLNHLDPWVEIRRAGASDAAGTAKLHRSKRFGMYHSLVPFEPGYVQRHMSFDELDEVEVPLEPLDDLLGRFERIDLVKVDVEGAEAAVLRGARGLIAAGIVQRFSVEVNRPRSGDAWRPFVDELRALGAAGWTFATLEADGTPVPTPLDPVLETGRASQLLVERL
ncbi:MAG: Methyltransferase FkbM family [Solirubrobacterales bacterium]|nr:Methyltransferase FkbM family [Solirubrobacterales bacterium]